jgi:hypothetical protein
MLLREVGSSRDVRARPARVFAAAAWAAAGSVSALGCSCGLAQRGFAGDGGVPGDAPGDDDVGPAQQGAFEGTGTVHCA